MFSYLKCFNDVKLALLKKNRYTYINITRKNTIIIKLLNKYNVILGFRIVTIRREKIYLVYVNTSVNYFNLKNLHKLSNPRFLKYHELKSLANKNTGTKYILSSSIGFIDIKEAVNKKIGGILLFRLY